VPKRYLPKGLTRTDQKRQREYLKKSRKMYRKGQYFSRPQVLSFKSKKSKHILKAERMYKVQSVKPSEELAKKTGCSVSALNQIVKKGEGAYYSSGSRPNQTARSWGLARLASSITGGKASSVDFSILDKGCNHNGRAYKLAKKSAKVGRRRVPKTFLEKLF
jgi:hypothetical protein